MAVATFVSGPMVTKVALPLFVWVVWRGEGGPYGLLSVVRGALQVKESLHRLWLWPLASPRLSAVPLAA